MGERTSSDAQIAANLPRLREFFWRLRESPKDYRYGGARAALRWIFKGVAADADD